jgi:hypothetical protein
MNRFSALIFSLGLLGGCAPAPSPAPLPTSNAPTADVVERALAAVVLVVSTRDDGRVVYGSGVVLDGQGLVVTNAHVLAGARSVRAMLYAPGRISYTPMDGGLTRYLFEYERDLVNARVERADDVTDLALLRLDADTSRLPVPRAATRLPRRGERVFSIGHPQENVWSFTAGQVSALHHGAVQHDALLSYGSSGGPLLNERGELLGINTSKVISEARGLSFARPVAMVEALVSSAPSPHEIDLSTPERAAKSCWLARELASPAAAGCAEAGSARPLPKHETPRRPGSASPPDEASRRPLADAHPTQKDEASRRVSVATCAATVGAAARQHGINDMLPTNAASPPSAEATSLAPSTTEGRPKPSPLSRGVRVEQVRALGETLAWVQLEARTAEGKPLGISELYVRVGERWLQRVAPSPDERATLPPGWPAPLHDLGSAPAGLGEPGASSRCP